MEQGERIKELRKALNMTMEQFGDKIGVTKSTISNIENGNRNATEHMLKSICREYNTNYDYLVYGDGEMFGDLPETLLDELCLQHNLDELDRSILELYLEMPEDIRSYIKQAIRKKIIEKGKE